MVLFSAPVAPTLPSVVMTVIELLPENDPATMRDRTSQMGRRRTLDEEKTQPGVDRPQATPGGREACLRCLGPGGRQGAWRKRGDLQPLAEPLRQDESRRDEASQGARKGECPPEEAGGRSSPGHPHPKGGEPKKHLSPARRREAIQHVRSKLSVSERRACRVLGEPRSTQRYAGQEGKRTTSLKRGWSCSRERTPATATAGCRLC
jgi:hypothetical protein